MKELANLTKLYTKDTKYSGEDDNFNYKLMIFHDLYKKAALPQQAFAQAYSTMLCGLALDQLTKFCSFCQKYGRSLGRFKFTLREDLDFNHLIFIDIMYIEGSLILHIIDKAT